VLFDVIGSNVPLYRQRFLSAKQVPPAYPPDTQGEVLTGEALRNLIESKALPADTAAQERRGAYAGTYFLTPSDPFVVSYTNGKLAWDYHGSDSQYIKNTTLTEVEPGLLVSEIGNTLDLRGPVPAADNLRLVRATPQALLFKTVLYALCALLFLSALFLWPARAFIWRIREKRGQAPASEATKGGPWPLLTGGLAALASLSSLFCLGMSALAQSVPFPWPDPWPDLLWWQSALIQLPFAGLLLGAGIGPLALLRSPGLRPLRWYYLAVALALVVFNGMLVF
jgi:hypothetical protein